MPPASESPATPRNYADSIIAVAREAEANKAPSITTVAGVDVIVDRNGKVESLERFAANPRRKRATVSLYEIASFIGYVNRHKVPGFTHLFGRASESQASFTALIDFHGDNLNTPAESAAGVAPVKPSWAEHKAVVTLEITPEWQRWLGNDRKLLSQEAFAEFIEENMSDVIEPDGATLLEVAQGLQGRKDVTFKSGKNLRDGAITFEYSEQVIVNGSANRRDDTFKIPEKFKLGLVPFVGANGVEIEARLRFRIGADGKVFFAYVLDRPFKIIETAFSLARADIEDATGIKISLGSATVPSV